MHLFLHFLYFYNVFFAHTEKTWRSPLRGSALRLIKNFIVIYRYIATVNFLIIVPLTIPYQLGQFPKSARPYQVREIAGFWKWQKSRDFGKEKNRAALRVALKGFTRKRTNSPYQNMT